LIPRKDSAAIETMHHVIHTLRVASTCRVGARRAFAVHLASNSSLCLRSFSSKARCRSSAPQSRDDEKEVDIAILGGGVSGLSTAFYILAWHLRAFPGRIPKITIYEGSNRVGGWIQTFRKERDGLQWNFEHGPRTLRVQPESMLLQLVSVSVK
jgi:hypothetical protein